ncbi:MAG: hypothetical protein K8I02_02530, partial [Candidatus Methylomirabilis sp.]|nr:hypothetical protein [Deltaproteobacteria bacterium]
LIAVVLLAAGARAEEAASGPEPGPTAAGWGLTDDIRLEIPGDYRFRWGYRSAIDADAFGKDDPRLHLGEHRLRVEPKLAVYDFLSLNTQLDIFRGNLWSNVTGRDHLVYGDLDRADIDGFDADRFLLRKLWAEIKTPVGVVHAGRQGSFWGTGILANDGDGYRNDWGDARFGDIVDRVLFATKPVNLLTGGATDLNWIVAFAYDDVVDDDFTNRLSRSEVDLFHLFNGEKGENDDARQFILSTLYRSEIFDSGVYLVWREAHEGRNAVTGEKVPNTRNTTIAFVVDYYGRIQIPVGEGQNVFAEGEVAFITGQTEQNVANDTPTPPTRSDVDQLGWLVRGGWRSETFDAEAEVGYASGDDNPFDDNQRAFRFDRDFNPSLLLFEEALAAQTATAAYNLSDPSLVGTPPENIDNFPSNGSVVGAVYAKGTLRLRPTEELLLLTSVLYAQSEEDVADPFTMNVITGGANSNFLGGRGSKRELGWEVDWGAQYTIVGEWARLVLGVQAGWLFPCNAFDDAAGRRMNDVYTVQGRANVIW